VFDPSLKTRNFKINANGKEVGGEQRSTAYQASP
jgi:hypothetical protein